MKNTKSNTETPSTPSQHTPGPWEFARREMLSENWAVLADGKEIAVMQGAKPVWNGTATVFELLPDQANARLIAAAPDMLAALEYVFKRLDDATVRGRLTNSPFHPSWEKVRAALAQAKGEKS